MSIGRSSQPLIALLIKIGLKFSFGPLLPQAKIFASRIRWFITLRKLSKGDRKIVICALPKSGSTWLECLLSTAYDIDSIMPPEVSVHEFKKGHSHTWSPSPYLISRLSKRSFLMKVHSDNNEGIQNLAKNWGVKLIVLDRNIDDIIDSMYHYISVTRFHPEHKNIVGLTELESKRYLSLKYIPMYNEWQQSWGNDVLKIQYEEMLFDVAKVLGRIESHLGEKMINVNPVENCSITSMRRQAVHKDFYRGKRV